MIRFSQVAIPLIKYFILLLVFVDVSAQSEPLSGSDSMMPYNNIRQYLMSQAAVISEQSLSEVKTLADWKSQRSTRQNQLAEMLGLANYPVFESRPPVKVTYVDTLQQEGFYIVKLFYESSDDLYVSANLYIPDDLNTPAPAILYVCGHAPNQKSHYQSHARNFAENGFVTLLIETIQRGEAKGVHLGPYGRGWFQWYSQGYNPGGVEVWNGIRGIDLLTEMTQVDPDKIGVTGISGGGSQSWYIGALDDRIVATAAVAGAGSLEGQISTRTIDDHCDCMMPINTYLWDFSDIGALIAPRSFLVAQTRNDGYYSIQSVRDLFTSVKKIYGLYGQENNLSMIEAPGKHSYGNHNQMRPQILSFFWEKLHGTTKSPDELGPIDVSEVLSEEVLLVYDHHPPEKDRTPDIHESFIPLSESPKIKTIDELDDYRTEVRDFLKVKSFGAFPENSEPLKIRNEFSTWNFSTHGREYYSFVPETGWRLKVQIRRSALPGTEDGPLLLILNSSESHPQEMNRIVGGVRNDINIAYFDARGIGETSWAPGLNWHIRRSAAWTGRTLASMRVFDVLRCLETMRQTKGVDPDKIYILAEGEMAVVAAYAAIIDGNVKGLVLKDPPATQNMPGNPDGHNMGTEILNCLQITDFPQVVGLHYPERVTILGHVPESFHWTKNLYDELGRGDYFEVATTLSEDFFQKK